MVPGINNNEISIQDLAEDIRRLKEWLETEPNLPTITDDDWLETFLHAHDYSLEKTKRKMRAYYTLRNKYPMMLQNRDPTAPEMQTVRKIVNVSVSEITEDNDRMIFITFDPNASRFIGMDHCKRVCMIFDMFLLEKDRCNGYILVTDCKNVGYKYFLKIVKVMPMGSEVFNDAYTERIKAIHLINSSGLIKKMVDLILPYFPYYADKITIHTTSKNNVLEHVDEAVLPTDLGGRGPSIEKCDEYTQQKLEQHRSWFIEQDILTASMNPNPGKKKRGWRLWG